MYLLNSEKILQQYIDKSKTLYFHGGKKKSTNTKKLKTMNKLCSLNLNKFKYKKQNQYFKNLIDNIDSNVKENGKLQPKKFIFGYGSIINTESRIQTGGKTIGNAIPARIKKNAGLERVWNFQKPTVASLTALGLQNIKGSKLVDKNNKIKNPKTAGDTFVKYDSKKGSGSTINGVLYPIYENIEAFDEREEGYFRLRLELNQLEPLSWQNLPQGEDIIIYVYCLNVENQKQKATYELPILQSYVDVCIKGCLEYGSEFADEFIKTTKGWSKFWLNDRILPRRPWIKEPQFKSIDEVLKKNLKFSSVLPEDYNKNI